MNSQFSHWVKPPLPPVRSVTHLYTKEYGGFDMMVGYIHYQGIQDKLYLPLDMFRYSKHLMSVMLDIASGRFFSQTL